jgi:hypothetical protein
MLKAAAQPSPFGCAKIYAPRKERPVAWGTTGLLAAHGWVWEDEDETWDVWEESFVLMAG